VYTACYAERHPDTPERMAYHIQWYPDPDCRGQAQSWAESQERLEYWKIWNHWYLVPTSSQSREDIRREAYEHCLSSAKLPFHCNPY